MEDNRHEDSLPQRSTTKLMFSRPFGLLFWGMLVSTCGLWVHNVAIVIVVFDATHSVFLVGLATVAQIMPQLLAPVSAKYVDRMAIRPFILAGQALAAIGSGGIGLSLWLGHSATEAGLVVIYVGSVISGLGVAVRSPAILSGVAVLSRPSELNTATALASLPMTVGRSVGPALGAAAGTLFGFPLAFTVAAAMNLFFALVLLGIPFPQRKRRRADDYSVRALFSYVRSDRTLCLVLIGVAFVSVGSDPSITLTPALVHEMGAGTATVGYLSATFGVTAAAAALLNRQILSSMSLPRMSHAGIVIVGASLLLALATPVPALVFVAYGVGGFGMGMAFTGLAAQVQHRSPDFLRGRIMALWTLAVLLPRPITAVATGVLSDHTNVFVAFISVAAAVLVFSWWIRPARLPEQRGEPMRSTEMPPTSPV